MKRAAAFAIPGDIGTLTGGYIYERRLLEGLRACGHPVRHIQLAGSFPDPDPADMADAVARLQEVDASTPVIIDGLVFGAIDTAGLGGMRAPILAMIHHPLALESGLSEDRVRHFRLTERNNLRHAARVIVPSPHTRRILVDSYGVNAARITVARPGTTPPASDARNPVSPPLILSVGILHPRKGHDVLLRALSRIKSHDWRAVIVGKEHEPGELRRLGDLRDALGLSDKVDLAGMIDSDTLDRLYRDATIFALATRYEGYGIVLDEALSYGLPIVSSRVGAVPDTVPEGAGLLVPVEDGAAFATALTSLLSEPDLRARMSDAAARAGRALPAWGDTANIVSRVLQSLP